MLEIITQTESKYLKQRASKDIGTVGNMLNWVVAWFVCFKKYKLKCMLSVRRRGGVQPLCDIYYVTIFGLHVCQARHTIDDLRETYVYVYMIKAIQENTALLLLTPVLPWKETIKYSFLSLKRHYIP